ncbi:MAG: SpoIIE family protein phosphatase [Planctomycetota bacterium]
MNAKRLLDEDSDSSDSYVWTRADSKQVHQPTKKRNVLVIEDSRLYFQLLQNYLAEAVDVEFRIEHADQLSDGLNRLRGGRIHLVLLDLMLPDSSGLATFQQVKFHAPGVPIIVITGLDDESVASQAVSEGAADFLIKEKLDADLLLRSIDYARARHKSQAALSRALQLAQANEANLHNVINSSIDGMIVLDDQGNVLFSNPAARALFGRTEREIQRHPFGLPLLAGESRELDLLRNGGGSVSVEMRAVKLQWQARPASLVSLRDLTLQKRAKVDRSRRKAAEHEIDIACKLIESLFPPQAPALAGFDIAGAAFPAGKGSGDYFDFIPMREHGLGLVVADVSGHGLSPAMMMVQTRAYLRALTLAQDDVGQILSEVNQLLSTNETGRFATLFFCHIDSRSKSFTYASAGHRGYLLRASGEVIYLDSTGRPLGVVPGDVIPTAPAAALESGDLMFLPTDGIQESRSPGRELFGVARALDVLRANREKPAQEIIQALYKAARDWAQGQPQDDDITAVVIKVID